MAPEWMGSEGAWFLALNAVVVAIAFLSRARPSLDSTRHGGITRRASSAVLQRLRSFSIFSYPSACLSSYLLPDAAAATSHDTEEPVETSSPINRSARTPRAVVLLTSARAAEYAAAAEEEEEEGDPNAMSMDEAYALVVAGRQRPESEREAEARRSEVDAKAEEFVQGFKQQDDDLRQQRLDSIFNYTQMLKQRAHQGGSRRR